MKKIFGLAAVGVAVGAVSVAAWAATIQNVSGQSCGDFLGNWHFVNTQSGGGTAPLSVCFTSGCVTGVQPSKVLTSTTHYNVSAAGTLVSGSNTNPGKLVLSDFTCEEKKCDKYDEKGNCIN